MSNIIKVKKVLDNAVVPTKGHASDAGYDITLVKKIKNDKWGTIWYDTGLQIEPPAGHHTELVGRSSLVKKGWQVANCVGIIDESYRGNIMVALTKLHPDVPELELPNRACQLIVRKTHHVPVYESRQDLTATARGSGGFGSTDI